jgi:hypothetical protein
MPAKIRATGRASEEPRSGSQQRVGRRRKVARRTDLQISKWWAWGWAGASGKHAAMNLRGETTGRKLKRIERRMRAAVRRWEAVGRSQPPTDRAQRQIPAPPTP